MKPPTFYTNAVNAGEDRNNEHRSVTTPIYQTATYSFEKTQDLHDFFQGKTNRITEYGRYGNPTQEIAQKKLTVLEKGAESCLLFSSGMTAICYTMLAICKQGTHIIITNESYRRTRQFALQVLSKFGIECTFVDPNVKDIENAIKKNTKLLISESPTNPYLHVLDLEMVARVCKKHKIKSLIDATFATPFNQCPLEFGIDLVVHSATKYLGGHNDLLGGAVLGSQSLISAIKDYQSIMGGLLDPNSCFLLIRGLKTFALRMEQQNASALKIAQFLEKHPKVSRVWYPGLKSHPNYDIAIKQMRGFGGVISFRVNSSINKISDFIDALKLYLIAPSLGGVDSLIEQPALMSYYDLTMTEREDIGIYNDLVRISIGIESTDDLIMDLTEGLKIA